MKKLTLRFALVFVVAFQALANDRPEFVKAAYKEFQAFDSYRERAAFAKPYAWGTGTYRLTESILMPFEWFTWTNTDAYFQMKIGTQVYSYDLRNVRKIKDIIDRPYEATSKKGLTYIGLSNDWAFDEKGMPFCSVKKTDKTGFTSTDYDKCDYPGVLRYYLKILQEKVPQLRFEIVEEMR